MCAHVTNAERIKFADDDYLGKKIVAEALLNVDGEGLVWTTPKTHERRVVSVPAFLRPQQQTHLTTYTEGGSGQDDLVFTAPTGAPLRHNLLTRRYFRPAVKRVLPPVRHRLRLHDLRQTAASLLLAAGHRSRSWLRAWAMRRLLRP